jgi:hypothetical protein
VTGVQTCALPIYGQAYSLFHRHLDYDYKTNAQYDNPANSVKTLPNSLYLTSKPAFFGNCPWPWVNPAGATHADRVKWLPAKNRYDAADPCGGTPVTLAPAVAISRSGPALFTLYNIKGQAVRSFYGMFDGRVGNVRLAKIERALPNRIHLLKITQEGIHSMTRKVVVR